MATQVAAAQPMQAIVQSKYGSPENVLALKAIATPVVTDDTVLVRVRAASLSVGDCYSVRGAPFAMRLVSGLIKPKHPVPGFDVAGEVVAVGPRATQFRAGDAVFGAARDAWAEYARIGQDKLAPMPANLSFVEAAAVPTSALAALHGLRDVGQVRSGQQVLINGASGGVGTFAVQIAKAFGAEVTGVCGTTNVDLVRSLGADHVIDYTQADFTQGGPRYDLIFDNVENRSLSQVRRALKPGGTLVLNSGTGARGLEMLVRLAKPFLVSPFVGQRLRRYLSVPKQADLIVLKELIEVGKLRPVVDRTYPLPEIAAALRYLEGRHARGKVVITVAS